MAGTEDKIKQLIETFTNNIDYYKSGGYIRIVENF